MPIFAYMGATGQKILSHTTMYDEHGDPDRAVIASILEIARRDHCQRFEFIYSSIDRDGTPNFVGVRRIYGFGMNSFNRFREFVKSGDSPFTPLATDAFDSAGQNKKRINGCDKEHPSYGWLYVSIREFMGHMTESKFIPPKRSLFTTLLPFSPASGKGNSWAEAFMRSRQRPGRETLSDDALEVTALKEGATSNRMVACAIDLHMCARYLNRIYYHGAGYYVIKDTIPIACMALAFFTDTGSILYNSPYKFVGGPGYGIGPGVKEVYDRDKMTLHKALCPTCGGKYVCGLHMCAYCGKPIYYPEGMRRLDADDAFGVQSATQISDWMMEALQQNNDGKYEILSAVTLKPYRNLPASRSLAEEHRKTAFFGVPPIKCTMYDVPNEKMDFFRRNVRGALQG